MFAIAFLVRAFGSVNDYVDFVCFALGSLLDAALRFLGFSPWLLTGFDLVSGGLVDLWVGDGPLLASAEVFVEQVWRATVGSAVFGVVHHEMELLIGAVICITHILIRVLWITWEHSLPIATMGVIRRIISIPYHIWTLALVIGELAILKTISRWGLIQVSTLVKRGVSIVAVIQSCVHFVGHLDNSSIALFVHQGAMIHQRSSVVQGIHGQVFHLLVLENGILQHSLLLNMLLVDFGVGPSRVGISFLVMLHVKLAYVICCVHRLLHIR